MSLNIKRIHFYVLKSFIRPFLLTFFIGLVFLQLQFLYRHLGELAGKGVDLMVIAEMMAYVSVALLPFNFPLSVLLASVITFGTLGENYELVAMKSAGISLYQIIKPLLVVAGILSLFAFVVANNVIPETNVRYMTILEGLQKQRPELLLTDGVFTNEIDGYGIKVDRIDKNSNEIFDVIIYKHASGENEGTVTVAPYGTITSTEDKRYVIIRLTNGTCYHEGHGFSKDNDVGNNAALHRKTSFDNQVLRIRTFNFDFTRANEAVFSNHHRMLTITELNKVIENISKEYRQLLTTHIDSIGLFQAGGILNRSVLNSNDLYRNMEDAFKLLSVNEKLEVINVAKQNVRKNIQVILNDKEKFHESQQTRSKYQLAKHRKITFSLAIFLFFLIGSSFGAVVRKGGFSVPMVFCFILLVIYYIIGLFGERMVLAGVLTVFEGAWLPFCPLVPLALWLTYLSVTDSTILLSDSYSKLLKRVWNLFQPQR